MSAGVCQAEDEGSESVSGEGGVPRTRGEARQENMNRRREESFERKTSVADKMKISFLIIWQNFFHLTYSSLILVLSHGNFELKFQIQIVFISEVIQEIKQSYKK